MHALTMTYLEHDHAGKNGQRGEHHEVDWRNHSSIECVQCLKWDIH